MLRKKLHICTYESDFLYNYISKIIKMKNINKNNIKIDDRDVIKLILVIFILKRII